MCRRGLAQGLSVVVQGEERPARRTRAQTHLLRRLQERREGMISGRDREKGVMGNCRKERLWISDFRTLLSTCIFVFFSYFLCPLMKKMVDQRFFFPTRIFSYQSPALYTHTKKGREREVGESVDGVTSEVNRVKGCRRNERVSEQEREGKTMAVRKKERVCE